MPTTTVFCAGHSPSRGGREIDTQGDSLFVGFPRASNAALAAAEAQRALARHAWPGGLELGVRMGIHTGGASVAGDRYLGLAVHRAARICAAGNGGQIVLSQATYTLLEDEEDLAGLSLRDLGEHMLKDFDRPVRLYQLVVPDLPTEFPPLRTVEAEMPFSGCESELAEAVEAAVAAPFLRRHRRALLAASALLVAAGAAALGLALAGGSSNAPPVRVVPNSVAVIDPKTNRVTGDVRVGESPSAVAFGGGHAWVANLNSQSVSRIDPRTLVAETKGTRAVRPIWLPEQARSSSASSTGSGSSSSTPTVTCSRQPRSAAAASSRARRWPGSPQGRGESGSATFATRSSLASTQTEERY